MDTQFQRRSSRLRRFFGFAVAAVSWAVGSASAAAQPVPVHLTIDAASVPAPIQQAALAEVSRLWAPYGFDVGPDVPGGTIRSGIAIRIVCDMQRHDRGDELGEIQFDADGTPSPTVTILYGAVAHLAQGAEVLGTNPAELPVRARDGAIGRAVGRVLAHEIGHFLLRSPHHPDSGLMRARFDAAALTSPDAGLFQLTRTDRDRLEIVRRALYAPTPASTAETAVAARTRGSQAR